METIEGRHKRLLGIDGDLHFLTRLEKEISREIQECDFRKASTFEEACGLMRKRPYDLIITDPAGFPGSHILFLAFSRKIPVLALSDRDKPSELLSLFNGAVIRTISPKNGIQDIVASIKGFLETDSKPSGKQARCKLERLENALIWRWLPKSPSRYFPFGSNIIYLNHTPPRAGRAGTRVFPVGGPGAAPDEIEWPTSRHRFHSAAPHTGSGATTNPAASGIIHGREKGLSGIKRAPPF